MTADLAAADIGTLDSALLDAAARGATRMLPASAYTSDDVLAWERRHLFAGTWMCVGREDDLRRDGDGPVTQRAVVVGDVAVLLTWEGETLHALANTCRHRGHELIPPGETSSRRSVICPYHAWTYDLTGQLRAAPDFKNVDGFAPTDHSLSELPVERWHGWVFVHALHGTVPFGEHVGALEEVVAPYAPETLVLGARHSYEVGANWKVISENYHECYHCPLIHPELCQVSPPTSGENYDGMPGAWVGGWMDLRDGMATMSLTGEAAGEPIPGVDPRRVAYVQLWPNLLLSPHPDYLMVHRLVPLAPNRTWVECSWYVLEAGPDTARAVEFWDITNKQDWKACESVQRGLASPHFRPGPFAPAEDAVQAFVAMVSRGYLGEALHLP